MSDYFRVLKRLEREKAEREAPALPGHATRARPQAVARVPVASTVTPLVAPTAAPPTPATPATAPSAPTARGLATLFDNIRALASGRQTRMVVFAGAAAAGPAVAVATGLANLAERYGMSVLLADLRRVGGHATLVPNPGGRTRVPHLVGSGDEPLTVDLDGGTAYSDLERWIERSAPATELVIVTGPSLGESIDAALLAGACDGLVIVAESEVTDRRALQAAAERARVAGCRTLGVVMHGTLDRTPAWMHRLMGGIPQT